MILCGFFMRDVVTMQWKKMENNITFILLMEGCVRQIGFYSEPTARYLNKKATAQSRLITFWSILPLVCVFVGCEQRCPVFLFHAKNQLEPSFCMVLMLLSEMAISGLCTLNIFVWFPFDVTRGPHVWWLWAAMCYFHV